MKRARRAAIAEFRRLRPRVAVSVGGYASMPAVFAAWKLDVDITMPVLAGRIDFDRVVVEHVGPNSCMGVAREGIYVEAPHRDRTELVGFAGPAIAGVTYMRSYSDFEYVPSIMLPMFLFSGTFYPVSSYGDWAWLAQLSPLYHGVVVVRGLNLGEWSWTYIPHLGVLVAIPLLVRFVSGWRRTRESGTGGGSSPAIRR